MLIHFQFLEVRVMIDGRHAVFGDAHIELEAITTMFDGCIEGCKGVFRRIDARTTMAEEEWATHAGLCWSNRGRNRGWACLCRASLWPFSPLPEISFPAVMP